MTKTLNLTLGLALIFTAIACKPKPSPKGPKEAHQPYPFNYDESLKPFYQGVASGDPLAESVIIWTRITPEYEDTLEVNWTMYADAAQQQVVASGATMTHAGINYHVKTEVSGLEPDRHYFYQFDYQGARSLLGRTKTAPVNPETVNLAFAACSNYEAGYFNAYLEISKIDSLDAVVHLGDYIYEYEPKRYGDSTLGRFHYPAYEIKTLDDYRGRYAQYRTDPDLIRAHQMHPWITIWDDHEISNNAYNEGAENHQPDQEGDWQARKKAARQAYYEWLPLRETPEGQLYRKFAFGDLVDLIMLDGRLAGRSQQLDSITQEQYFDPTRGMLGEAQRSWLVQNLKQSTAQWKILGNPVIFAGLYVGHFIPGRQRFMDMWDGYPVERQKILETIKQNNIDGFLVVTGDFHSSMAMEVYQDPLDLSGYKADKDFGVLGAEFVVHSITSANLNESFPDEQVDKIKAAYQQAPHNPHIKYANFKDHGYFLLHLNRNNALAQWVYMDRINQHGSDQKIKQQFLVNAGEGKLRPVKAKKPL